MARIQILNLPDELIDGKLHNRFVLVLDEHPNGGGPKAKKFAKEFDRFALSVGAAGGIVSKECVEIVGEEPSDDVVIQFDHAALLDTISTAVRAHLESAEASDAFRADVERRMAAGQQPTEVHHHHHAEPRFDGTAMQEFVARSEARQRGGH